MMTNKTNSAVEHISTVRRTIAQLIEQKFDFVAFVQIALGIEFLGSFYDSNAFSEGGQSEIRFKAGLSLFKNQWYQQNKSKMYTDFRGPLVHQFWTGSVFYLTSKINNGALLTEHLQERVSSDRNSAIVLVVEKLFEDFETACDSLITLTTRQNSLNKSKLSQVYAERISLTDLKGQTYASSGSTATTVTIIPKVK